jgi:hypothetical protein
MDTNIIESACESKCFTTDWKKTLDEIDTSGRENLPAM